MLKVTPTPLLNFILSELEGQFSFLYLEVLVSRICTYTIIRHQGKVEYGCSSVIFIFNISGFEMPN